MLNYDYRTTTSSNFNYFIKILAKHPNNEDAQFLKEECLENL